MGKASTFPALRYKVLWEGKAAAAATLTLPPAHHGSLLGPQEKKVKEKPLSLTLGCLLFSAVICIEKTLPKS